MEPFFGGMAIGLMLLILLGIPILLLSLVGAFFYGFFRAAFTSDLARRIRGRADDSRSASQPQA